MENFNTNYFSSKEERQYAMCIHFAQFAGCVIPVLGWLAPLILWQMKKETSSYIDTHGKIVMNWVITSFIFSVVSAILAIIGIGIILLGILAVCSFVFAILGGLKANEGVVWEYPFIIKFIK